MSELPSHFTRVLGWFETLTPATLADIHTIYCREARFRDPFNNIAGLTDITRVYQHMFDTLQSPRFSITQTVVRDEQAFVTWDFNFGIRGKAMQIQGCTHFVLNAQGLITLHRDYWDTAEELYEKLPVLGSLMRWLKRKFTTRP